MMPQIETAVKAAMAEGHLPPKISGDVIREFVDGAVREGDKLSKIPGLAGHALKKELEALEKTVTHHATRTARDSWGTYVEHQVEIKEKVDPRVIAETAVIQAEDSVIKARLNDPDAVPVVNDKKHRSVVDSMTHEIYTSGIGREKKGKGTLDAGKIIDKLVASQMNQTKETGFYTKETKKGQAKDPEHVSIKKSRAVKNWVVELNAL